MGTNSNSSLLTVQSLAPTKDATFLQNIFPKRFHAEYLNEGRTIVLRDLEGRTTMFLIRALTTGETTIGPDLPRCHIVTWVVEEEEIKEGMLYGKDGIVRIEIGRYFVDKICLPSGSSVIYMIPSHVLDSHTERVMLAAELTTVPDVPQHIQKHQYTPGLKILERKALHQEPILLTLSTLRSKLLTENNQYKSFPLNSQKPAAFETDLFKGHTIALVRPPNPEVDDGYWNERVFSKKRRRFIIQIQGKFKRKPLGTLYAGGEVSEQMKLGLITRGLCSVLLKLIESFNNNIHYSFGDDKNKERPHIVAPAYNFFDCVIATPPGENPPGIEELFEEPAESVSRRKKSATDVQWNTSETYSFSFYSMYIDVANWQLVEVPALGDLSLKTFWATSLLNICIYEKTNQSKQHYQEDNTYAFSIQMEFLGKHQPTTKQESSSSDSKESNDNEDIIHWTKQGKYKDPKDTDLGDLKIAQILPNQKPADRSFSAVVNDDDDNDLFFFDAKEEKDNDSASSLVVEPLTRPVCFGAQLLARIDDVCPACIELCSKRGGNYNKKFVLNFSCNTYVIPEKAGETLLRQASNKVNNLITTNFSSRMSSMEVLRRSLGILFSLETSQSGIPKDRIQSFMNLQDRFDDIFTRGHQPVLTDKQLETTLLSCLVARAISDRHWIEELAVMSSTEISFLNPSKSRKQFCIPISSLLHVEKFETELCPRFRGFHFIILKTPGRSHYLMFPTRNDQNSWIDIIVGLQMKLRDGRGNQSLNDIKNSPLIEIGSLADEFLHKSTMWNCKNRHILNCGKFIFREVLTVASSDPLELVENALRKGLEPGETLTQDCEQRREFFDCAAALKQASVYGMSHNARLAFFLNLYHVMITHAYLVLGPPDSSLKWITYFNNVTYEVGDDIFSLAELEHCIIRAKMSYPSHFISRFVIPKSMYSVAIEKSDYRINFALNCGSLSNPKTIIVYRPDILQDQLDQACQLYLDGVSCNFRNTKELELRVPKICQWFLEDFGSSREDLLKKLYPFLSEITRSALAGHWISLEQRFDTSCCHVRYESFSFDCRPLSLVQQESHGQTVSVSTHQKFQNLKQIGKATRPNSITSR